jgi:hypothetical protein
MGFGNFQTTIVPVSKQVNSANASRCCVEFSPDFQTDFGWILANRLVATALFIRSLTCG